MSLGGAVKRIVVGRKLASSQLGETLLPKRVALPVFASDALSSVAYAPDEIFLTLSLAGMAGYGYGWEIGLLVAVVMVVVILSYRQTVHAYPKGGGGYEVARHNLGPFAGLVVASALLVDYTLTVAVSVSSGIQNAEAAIPWLASHQGIVGVAVVLAIMTMNLRGVRESGAVFAIPTYGFMIAILGMVGIGLFRVFVLREPLAAPTHDYTIVADPAYQPFAGGVAVLLLARAFSSGSAALTGVEAISNSVPAFRHPKSRNAATTLALLGLLAVSMLLGIIALSQVLGIKLVEGPAHFELNGVPVESTGTDTIIGQMATTIFSGWLRPGFYVVVAVTAVILFIAANTAFNGFPVLSSILAKDGYLPRQLHQRGDRLAYSNGIVILALVACALIWIYDANVSSMIQLYVVGVFVSFTLSQAGMIVHWTRELRTAPAGTRGRILRSRVINGVGMAMSAIVLVIVLVSKFTHGAYLAIIAMAVLFVAMRFVKKHYEAVEREVAWGPNDSRTLPSRTRGVVLVGALNKPTVLAISVAKAARLTSLEAVTVALDTEQTSTVVEDWDEADFGIPLRVIASPYREMVSPVVSYVKRLRSANPRDIVCVYVPEYVVGHWWEQILHNQTALAIRTRLHFTAGVLVTSVPYQLASSRLVEERVDTDDPFRYRSLGAAGQVDLSAEEPVRHD